MKPGIAFFDFDGTITTKDTLLEFIKYSKGKNAFYLGFLLHIPYLIAMKLKLISNQKTKEEVLSYFFGSMSLPKFEELCTDFATNKLPSLIRKDALTEIKKLQQKEIEIVIVSASPQNWITQWASLKKIQLIATKLELKNNRLTGKIEGNNCYGQEKVNRIKKKFQLSSYREIYAYGDSSGDEPMLQLAHHQYWKPFR